MTRPPGRDGVGAGGDHARPGGLWGNHDNPMGHAVFPHYIRETPRKR